MGGNALKIYGFESRRLSASEFDTYVEELTPLLKTVFLNAAPVLAYRTKESHGDIDFVAEAEPGSQYAPPLQSATGASLIHTNGDVVSFDYRGVQVDVSIQESPVAYESKLAFCHWAPFGNSFSRMISQTGAKYGHYGLVYPVKLSASEQAGVIPLSTDMTRILTVGGLDPAKWHAGFETQQDIFDYSASCPFFNEEMFRLENLNAVNRKRDRVRKDYNAWLKFITGPNAPANRFPWTTDKERLRREWLPYIVEAFPEVRLVERIEEIKDQHAALKAAAQKFNGTHVEAWTGLQGAQYAPVLHAFKTSFGDEVSFKLWVSQTPIAEIKERFMEFYRMREGD